MAIPNGRFMLEPEAIAILEKYGIPYPARALARNGAEAGTIAETLGFPVVLKIVSAEVPHKSEAGGVAVNLVSREAVEQAWETITAAVRKAVPGAAIEGMLVCAQAPEGVEAIVGGIDDASLGPTLMFGLGGIFAEILGDVAFRSIPLTRLDVDEMIREIKGFPLLTGARGKEPCDLEALAALLLAVAELLADNPDFAELDCNPVRLYPHGLMVLDARIFVAEASACNSKKGEFTA